MEPHVRDRLTGAGVLVALIVLLVPELLTGRRSPSPASASTGGDPGPPMRSYTIDLAADASRSMPLATVSAAAEAALPAAVPAPAPPAASAPEAVAPQQPRPAATESSGGWHVQLGSFSNRGNAERLSRELAGKGYAAHISPTRGGSRELFRVRVGATASREEAAALAERLRASGYQGALVPPS